MTIRELILPGMFWNRKHKKRNPKAFLFCYTYGKLFGFYQQQFAVEFLTLVG